MERPARQDQGPAALSRKPGHGTPAILLKAAVNSPSPAPPCAALVQTDAVVIGAGPVGLFQVFQLGLQGLACHVIDALPHAGGQCAELYGDKPIYDIPGIQVCTGQQLADRLLAQIAPFAPHWHLGEQATVLEPQADGSGFLIETAHGTRLQARAVFVAAGVGAFVPRTLKAPGLDAFEGTQLHYAMPPDATLLAGQQVVVHGGDEPAVSLVLELAETAGAHAPARITLQHRRDVFDAPEAALQQLEALRAAGRVQVAVGQVTGTEQTGERLRTLQLLDPDGNAVRLPLDQLIVRLGLLPRLGPVADWGLALERKQLPVNPATLATQVPGIYAVGDVVYYPGKRKLILSGFHEATLAAFAAAEQLAGQKVPLEYTTSSERLQRRLGVFATGTGPAQG